ncbi:hypothetical protein ACWDSJ_31330 [Nocardia sp. NPDC003482]
MVAAADPPDPADAPDPGLVHPVASQVENQRAMGEFATEFGIAVTTGGFIGSAIGLGVGAAVGCVIVPAVGCIPGALSGASLGAIIGTLVVGGPTLAISGADLITTLNSPPGSTRWSDENYYYQKPAP